MTVLFIDDRPRELTPIKQFRAEYELPDAFGAAAFEPKSYEGLGAIDKAGTQLNLLRQALLDAVPARLTLAQLMPFFDDLQQQFRQELYTINDSVGLRDEEVEFAAAGFGDVNRTLLYALIQANALKTSPPEFESVYFEWLNSTVRVSRRVHGYSHQGDEWRIQMINHAYGRVGLRVDMGHGVAYVQDNTLACPAEGFMQTLLAELSRLVRSRLA